MFSKTYLKQPAGTNHDSARLRNRLSAAALTMPDYQKSRFVDSLRIETGANLELGTASYVIRRFFPNAEMRDILDAVTCMANAIEIARDRAGWIAFCQRAFIEEGMSYRVDDHGDVHYVVDVAFHENADSVIAALSRPPFVAAATSINKAVSEITQAEPDGKHAIRDVFEGVETAFKVITNSNKDLTVANIASLLGPLVERRMQSANPVAQGAAQQTLESMKDWTNACHKYRHGPRAEEPIEPPLELAIVLVGNGLNFVRWLASLAD
jgi:hypothetical protein